MLVLVRYNDDNYDVIEDYRLEYLIVTGKVAGFSRSDEWVSVGDVPIRERTNTDPWHSSKNIPYPGTDRRKHHKNLLHIPQIAATT